MGSQIVSTLMKLIPSILLYYLSTSCDSSAFQIQYYSCSIVMRVAFRKTEGVPAYIHAYDNAIHGKK